MYTLLLSISFSVAVSIFLKLAYRHDIRVEQAVAVNYLTALAACLLLLRPPLDTLFDQPLEGWLVLILLGFLLPGIFMVMAAAVRQAGIVLSDTAQRLSLLVPILASFLIFGEQLSSTKATGIVVAFAALACLVWRTSAGKMTPHGASLGKQAGGTQLHGLWILLGVWAGYGTIDVLFKLMARLGARFSSTLLLSFMLAALLIFAWLVLRRAVWHMRSLLSGVLLGALNFSNIYFYIRAHQTFPENPTLVFAAMNIGVISVGILVGAGLFGERPSRVNLLGIVLALAAVFLLLPR
ncbi:EamA/RhaT family transporter [Castellaniella sp.]|uniref:EamA family transporter n=1 Tax=Castellaniella sp. TaxID=1955812 RepID=UPI00355F7DA4